MEGPEVFTAGVHLKVSEWETGSEPRCQNTKHQKNIVKRLESGFELDHMPTYKEYHGPVSITDINDGKSYP